MAIISTQTEDPGLLEFKEHIPMLAFNCLQNIVACQGGGVSSESPQARQPTRHISPWVGESGRKQ